MPKYLLWRNAQSQAKRWKGVSPRRCGSPYAITPEQVLRHHRSEQGRYGGTGTVPSFIRTSILKFISSEKEFSRAKKSNVEVRKKTKTGS